MLGLCEYSALSFKCLRLQNMQDFIKLLNLVLSVDSTNNLEFEHLGKETKSCNDIILGHTYDVIVLRHSPAPLKLSGNGIILCRP